MFILSPKTYLKGWFCSSTQMCVARQFVPAHSHSDSLYNANRTTENNYLCQRSGALNLMREREHSLSVKWRRLNETQWCGDVEMRSCSYAETHEIFSAWAARSTQAHAVELQRLQECWPAETHVTTAVLWKLRCWWRTIHTSTASSSSWWLSEFTFWACMLLSL